MQTPLPIARYRFTALCKPWRMAHTTAPGWRLMKNVVMPAMVPTVGANAVAGKLAAQVVYIQRTHSSDTVCWALLSVSTPSSRVA